MIFAPFFSAQAVQNSAQVIYGDDSRRDLYQISDKEILKLADSTVALIKSEWITLDPANVSAHLSTKVHGIQQRLCRGERFFDQSAAASCSGALVAPNIILTAGHCIEDQLDCNQMSIVFGFALKQEGASVETIPGSEIYRCRKILRTSQGEKDDRPDYALVQLDRPVPNHAPLELNFSPIPEGTPLLVIGHPSGLPAKVASGAHVQSITENYFRADLDTFSGNSGSAVFNARTRKIEGILVRGAPDWVRNPEDQCLTARRCKFGEPPCEGESATRSSALAQGFSELLAGASFGKAEETLDIPAGAGSISIETSLFGENELAHPLEVELLIHDEIVSSVQMNGLKPGETRTVTLAFENVDPNWLEEGLPVTLNLILNGVIVDSVYLGLGGGFSEDVL